ncbi:MAG: hypothetical protein Faunusvirus11_2 [Faunusvirus sp.]|jgi:hypothetical protein|uniref:Uncharacterized protein n=1 Tax=Faunusvirus sp. TaxID=2487766 RepID=A0A3G5A0K1_9VIRU|nr:MAG: hypothetical protein Faunusvirus11_2 [Faunusvirus sp.]
MTSVNRSNSNKKLVALNIFDSSRKRRRDCKKSPEYKASILHKNKPALKHIAKKARYTAGECVIHSLDDGKSQCSVIIGAHDDNYYPVRELVPDAKKSGTYVLTGERKFIAIPDTALKVPGLEICSDCKMETEFSKKKWQDQNAGYLSTLQIFFQTDKSFRFPAAPVLPIVPILSVVPKDDDKQNKPIVNLGELLSSMPFINVLIHKPNSPGKDEKYKTEADKEYDQYLKNVAIKDKSDKDEKDKSGKDEKNDVQDVRNVFDDTNMDADDEDEESDDLVVLRTKSKRRIADEDEENKDDEDKNEYGDAEVDCLDIDSDPSFECKDNDPSFESKSGLRIYKKQFAEFEKEIPTMLVEVLTKKNIQHYDILRTHHTVRGSKARFTIKYENDPAFRDTNICNANFRPAEMTVSPSLLDGTFNIVSLNYDGVSWYGSKIKKTNICPKGNITWVFETRKFARTSILVISGINKTKPELDYQGEIHAQIREHVEICAKENGYFVSVIGGISLYSSCARKRYFAMFMVTCMLP